MFSSTLTHDSNLAGTGAGLADTGASLAGTGAALTGDQGASVPGPGTICPLCKQKVPGPIQGHCAGEGFYICNLHFDLNKSAKIALFSSFYILKGHSKTTWTYFTSSLTTHPP